MQAGCVGWAGRCVNGAPSGAFRAAVSRLWSTLAVLHGRVEVRIGHLGLIRFPGPAGKAASKMGSTDSTRSAHIDPTVGRKLQV